ncbi:hypothetical protein ANCDUO_15272 [Ancylostoma duodenale]|uniref:Mpv17 / PMP22 family protein n=1 Tax=Ancylostoma duodenale TaxID=51022 RepID=A0A0C2GC71_9BILA|nr:hypothetical protein ANCDUO_15272 [Ancylostoma duodenale]
MKSHHKQWKSKAPPRAPEEQRQELQKQFSRHLLLTNTSISVAQIGTADVMQQLFQGDIQRKGWDYYRTARMAAIGFVMGPMLHCFYRVLDSRAFRGGRRKVVFKKLCCDAACMPIFSCTFITVHTPNPLQWAVSWKDLRYHLHFLSTERRCGTFSRLMFQFGRQHN